MRKILLLIVLTSSVLVAQAGEKDIAILTLGMTKDDATRKLEFGFKAKVALNNVWLTLDLQAHDKLGLTTEAECKLFIERKFVSPASYMVYNRESISFYFEEVQAQKIIHFITRWNEDDIEPMSASVTLNSNEGTLSDKFDKYRYFSFIDTHQVHIIHQSGRKCHLSSY